MKESNFFFLFLCSDMTSSLISQIIYDLTIKFNMIIITINDTANVIILTLRLPFLLGLFAMNHEADAEYNG